MFFGVASWVLFPTATTTNYYYFLSLLRSPSHSRDPLTVVGGIAAELLPARPHAAAVSLVSYFLIELIIIVVVVISSPFDHGFWSSGSGSIWHRLRPRQPTIILK